MSLSIQIETKVGAPPISKSQMKPTPLFTGPSSRSMARMFALLEPANLPALREMERGLYEKAA